MKSAFLIPNNLRSVYDRLQEVEQQLADLLKEKKVIENSLSSQYQDAAQDQLHAKGKDFGQATIHTDDGFKVTIDFRKKVEWDQDQLISALDAMDGDTAKHYASLKVSVAEAKFQQAPPEIKAALSECRTVSLQGISVKIQEVGND